MAILPESSSYTPTILKESVPGTGPTQELSLLFLGCEAIGPYGPYEHTAKLFLDLIRRSLEECTTQAMSIRMTVYHVSQGHFPESIDDYQGVIIPGSSSAAYATDVPWIQELAKFIQTKLVPTQTPTLGVCFGHQLYAHSFPTGGAIKCPVGTLVGRKQFQATDVGQSLLQQADGIIDLFYAHGDMVESLPECALSLGGSTKVPIQGAVYFATPQDAANYVSNEKDISSSSPNSIRPMAITFQAHPEFASLPLGVEKTLNKIFDELEHKGDLSAQDRLAEEKDAEENYQKVERQSLDMMKVSCRLLGWVGSEK
jgi:GMP synthase-like glutamine amidotransferase